MSWTDGFDVLLICIICATLSVIIQNVSQMLFGVFQINVLSALGCWGDVSSYPRCHILLIILSFKIENYPLVCSPVRGKLFNSFLIPCSELSCMPVFLFVLMRRYIYSVIVWLAQPSRFILPLSEVAVWVDALCDLPRSIHRFGCKDILSWFFVKMFCNEQVFRDTHSCTLQRGGFIPCLSYIMGEDGSWCILFVPVKGLEFVLQLWHDDMPFHYSFTAGESCACTAVVLTISHTMFISQVFFFIFILGLFVFI